MHETAQRGLISGVDELGYILGQERTIAAYETARVCTVDTSAG